jgi:hypothetical protein
MAKMGIIRKLRKAWCPGVQFRNITNWNKIYNQVNNTVTVMAQGLKTK